LTGAADRAGAADRPGAVGRASQVRARAAIAAMFGVFLLADLAAGWLGVAGLTGFGFAAGSMIAAGLVRRKDLLIVVAAPPAIFLGAVTCGELITAHTDHATSVGSIAAGTFLTLSSAAIWMYCGLAATMIIAVVRGLPQCIRDLRTGLAGGSSRAGDSASRQALPDYRSARRSS
jgi:hypothetical protein